MNAHLKRSRVTKALTDAGLVASFSEAEARLDGVSVCVAIGADQAYTPAGQAATLTALATAFKSFGRVHLVSDRLETRLLALTHLGATFRQAALALGASVGDAIPLGTTHLIEIGQGPAWRGWRIHCWWDRWLAGTRGGDADLGDSRLGLSGVFAAALAVRQVFAHVRTENRRAGQDATVSLWAPWPAEQPDRGPARFTAPDALWMVGLGHLGQAFVWNLLTLPYRKHRRVVLQDDQRIGEENEATSLLVLPSHGIGERKARLASAWLEPAGWETQLIERRHLGDLKPGPNDPPFLLTGLDDLEPRKQLAGVQFDFMVDAGIGHGPGDFEGIQLRVIAKGQAIDGFWGTPADAKMRERLLASEAYEALARQVGACGVVPLADASVAVPFVGAATGALVIAQLSRLASMQPGGAVIQLELGAPHMVLDGGFSAAPKAFLGGEVIDLGDQSYLPLAANEFRAA